MIKNKLKKELATPQIYMMVIAICAALLMLVALITDCSWLQNVLVSIGGGMFAGIPLYFLANNREYELHRLTSDYKVLSNINKLLRQKLYVINRKLNDVKEYGINEDLTNELVDWYYLSDTIEDDFVELSENTFFELLRHEDYIYQKDETRKKELFDTIDLSSEDSLLVPFLEVIIQELISYDAHIKPARDTIKKKLKSLNGHIPEI